MSARQPIAAACTAVIAAAIEDALAEQPNASPAVQAAAVVHALGAEGWQITPGPLWAAVSAPQINTDPPETDRCPHARHSRREALK